jgi:transcriptional regulator of acetoin/glycerol metabolism
MKSFLTAEEAKDIREIAENLGKKERQESEKRYEDFLKTETGRAYKKFVEVFFPTSVYRSARGVFIDNQAIAKLYLDSIESGVPLGM